MEHFVAGTTARTAAEIVGVNKNTAQLFFHRLRDIIAIKQDSSIVFEGEVEADESYFGGKRKGKRANFLKWSFLGLKEGISFLNISNIVFFE